MTASDDSNETGASEAAGASGDDRIIKDYVYYEQVRRALGRGSRSLLFGTSNKALDRSVERLRAVRNEANRDALRKSVADTGIWTPGIVSAFFLLLLIATAFSIYWHINFNVPSVLAIIPQALAALVTLLVGIGRKYSKAVKYEKSSDSSAEDENRSR